MRRMFGKTGVFCEGVMLGMVADDVFYFRVDSQNSATFKEAESSPSLNYVKNGRTIDLSFWRAPDRLFDAHEELIAWAQAALAAAHRVAAKRGKATVKAHRRHPGGRDA
jgi:DNA transformation protein and related proteins